MKVLCISKWAKAPTSPEERDAIMPKEVPATLKLYLDGVIEQMWFKLDAPGVVFLVNAESVDAAKTHVHGRLAQVISERKVQGGLRRVLLTQAKRLQWLASRRFEALGGAALVEAEGEED